MVLFHNANRTNCVEVYSHKWETNCNCKGQIAFMQPLLFK